jgi:hypothetical protein
MKRIITIFFLSLASSPLFAQHEARVGIFGGVNNTSLKNAKDAAFGDFLPTFKPTLGIDAGYYFTIFKKLPIGFSFQLAGNSLGQNYNGNYSDSTSYYAYSRLNYFRPGIAFHAGSNMRKLVAFTFSAGATMGFLTSYQERFELIRYNNDRFILDINNNDVILYDTVKTRGTLTSPMYNQTDFSIFGTIGVDFMLTKHIVLGLSLRTDMGMSPVENKNKLNINYQTTPSSSVAFQPYNLDVKYRGPVSATAKRDETTNSSYGVFMSVKYRLFNPEKIEFWYREHKWE